MRTREKEGESERENEGEREGEKEREREFKWRERINCWHQFPLPSLSLVLKPPLFSLNINNFPSSPLRMMIRAMSLRKRERVNSDRTLDLIRAVLHKGKLALMMGIAGSIQINPLAYMPEWTKKLESASAGLQLWIRDFS